MPLHFLALQVAYTISRFGERFRDGQYSLDTLLFFVLLSSVPPVSSHLCPMDSRRHFHWTVSHQKALKKSQKAIQTKFTVPKGGLFSQFLRPKFCTE